MTNNQNEDQIFEALLNYLRGSRNFDFTGYKRTSLKRRVTKQMQLRKIDNFGNYLDYLQVHPEEFLPLFNTILINVTSFFRDEIPWQYLQTELIPRLLQHKVEFEPIRIWSAGCATGQEAYTLAIIFAEVLGVENLREMVKIYATDLDEEALIYARHASYTPREIELIPQELKDKYFDQIGENYLFCADLRRAVIFGRHDLVQDAPISRLDLLVCRNTLMYFNSETQKMILNRFHFALKNTGFIFLGKAEMLLTYTNLFIPIHLQYRIFQKIPKPSELNHILRVSQANNQQENNYLNQEIRLQALNFDFTPVTQLIINIQGNLVLANRKAKTMFGINNEDIGRPFQDLEISYRPVDLRSPIEQVYREGITMQIPDIRRTLPNQALQYLNIDINPLKDEGIILGVSITITDVSHYQELQAKLDSVNQELETATEEMQSGNEELETTNEELQSTNEELETTNEELQSTNEELETMNEELQSTNEELQTINDELRQRTGELNQANAFLNSILTSLKAGVIVLDTKFNILSWNHEAENLWGVRFEEVQKKSIFSLDIGLPIDQLQVPIRDCLTEKCDRHELTITAINRRGQTIQCRITLNPLIDSQQERLGVILVIEEI
jgi:two-component system, chemotaxis family, CheB/CheR fusion protein